MTLDLFSNPHEYAPGFNSLLLTLQKVAGIFDEAFKPFRFKIPKLADCLICRPRVESPADLDAAVDDALARLG